MIGVEHSDYLFANEDEAAEFGKINKIEGGLNEIAKALAQWKKVKPEKPRTVIVTQGAKSVIVATGSFEGDVEVKEYPVEALAQEEVIDTNGAGDAFVGGFMAQLYQDKPVDECVKAGIALSREVVKRSGCTFPEQFEFK